MWIWILTLITLLFTAFFAIILSGQSLEEIKANWPNVRCDVGPMILASFLKPDDSGQSGFAYATSNFQFCMEKNATRILQTAFGPLYSVIKTFLQAIRSVTEVLNSVRKMFAGLVQKFDALLAARFLQYKQIQHEAAKGFHLLQSATNRISAILTGFLFMGVSSVIGLLNLKDYVIKVVLIIVAILMAIVILLFLFMAPVIPVIVITIGLLAGAGISMGGAASVFCVDPHALVKMADGSEKPNHAIHVGDLLYSNTETPNIVTGMLYANGKDHKIVKVHGVCMSESHRVLYNGQMVLAGEHPDAESSTDLFDRLICLNTTAHVVPIVAKDGLLWVGDWQEIDYTEDHHWIDAINMRINPTTPYSSVVYPRYAPQIDPAIKICHEKQGWIHASNVNIGDSILDRGSVWTTVLAKYYGTYYGENVSDGVWYQHNDQWRYGYRPPHTPKLHYGIFFVTTSGTFVVQTQEGSLCVRDFTECGVQEIDGTYAMLDGILRKKTAPTI